MKIRHSAAGTSTDQQLPPWLQFPIDGYTHYTNFKSPDQRAPNHNFLTLWLLFVGVSSYKARGEELKLTSCRGKL